MRLKLDVTIEVEPEFSLGDIVHGAVNTFIISDLHPITITSLDRKTVPGSYLDQVIFGDTGSFTHYLQENNFKVYSRTEYELILTRRNK